MLLLFICQFIYLLVHGNMVYTTDLTLKNLYLSTNPKWTSLSEAKTLLLYYGVVPRSESQGYLVEAYRERNVLFNDTLNTFYLRLYGVRHMVKDHSDSEKGNLLPPHRQGFFYMHHPTDRITHTTAFVTPVVEHWLEWEIAQWVHPMKDRSDDPSHHEQTLYLWATSRSGSIQDVFDHFDLQRHGRHTSPLTTSTCVSWGCIWC